MKRFFAMLVIAGLLTACNENGNTIEGKLDSLGDRIDTTAEKIWDSTKAKAKDIKEDVEERLEDNDKDSTKK